MAAPDRPALPGAFLHDVRDAVRPRHLITDADVLAGVETDWTGRFRGRAGALVRPATTEEVAAVVVAARRHGVALVPRGGGTGLVGGAIPAEGSVVVDLGRLREVTDVDPLAGQLTAGAGVPLRAVQDRAAAVGWRYGVDWAARDTATMGGSVATNAGGLRYVAHGGTREQLLGIEAVLGTGEVVRHLPQVAKDNTGFHLAGLLCGSEGTLGLITAVRLRLVPPPAPAAVALIGFTSVAAAVEAAGELRRGLPGLEAAELVLADGLQLVAAHLGQASPLDPVPAAALLVEAGDAADPAGVLGRAVGDLAGVTDAAVAVTAREQAALWQHREAHTEAIARLGVTLKLDVTLPAPQLAPFVAEVGALVSSTAPGAKTWIFGHAADGNLHVNVTGVAGDGEEVEARVLEEVAGRGGSISGEHGIGRAKRRWLHLARGAGDRAAMAGIKRALDPDGVCNPGVLFGELR